MTMSANTAAGILIHCQHEHSIFFPHFIVVFRHFSQTVSISKHKNSSAWELVRMTMSANTAAGILVHCRHEHSIFFFTFHCDVTPG